MNKSELYAFVKSDRIKRLVKASDVKTKEDIKIFNDIGYCIGFTYDEQKGMYKCTAKGNKRVALFAHQGMGLLLLSIISLIPYPTFSTRFDMTHTGVTVIEFPEKDGYVLPTILTLSNDSHIYREGLPTKYSNAFYI